MLFGFHLLVCQIRAYTYQSLTSSCNVVYCLLCFTIKFVSDLCHARSMFCLPQYITLSWYFFVIFLKSIVYLCWKLNFLSCARISKELHLTRKRKKLCYDNKWNIVELYVLKRSKTERKTPCKTSTIQINVR